jgi:hypothetical protein
MPHGQSQPSVESAIFRVRGCLHSSSGRLGQDFCRVIRNLCGTLAKAGNSKRENDDEECGGSNSGSPENFEAAAKP